MPLVPKRPEAPHSVVRNYVLQRGDCLQVLPTVETGTVDLVFADPPFNIGWKYDVYKDSREVADYLDWTEAWLDQCRRVVSSTGSIWVSIGLGLQAEVKMLMSKAGFYWRDTVCWHYTFGPRQTKKLTPSWVPIHHFTADRKRWTWNDVRVPSARQLKYNDKRAVAGGKAPDNCWVLMPMHTNGCFQDGQNSWLESRVCGTFNERVTHPCQMPLPVLERIVLLSSRPGDLVLDPFLGSGTTGVAAIKNGRRFYGVELSEAYLTTAKNRIESELTERLLVGS